MEVADLQCGGFYLLDVKVFVLGLFLCSVYFSGIWVCLSVSMKLKILDICFGPLLLCHSLVLVFSHWAG